MQIKEFAFEITASIFKSKYPKFNLNEDDIISASFRRIGSNVHNEIILKEQILKYVLDFFTPSFSHLSCFGIASIYNSSPAFKLLRRYLLILQEMIYLLIVLGL